MVKRAGIAATPDALTSVVSQPSGSGAGALADTLDALGREAVQLNQRLQPRANDNAAKQGAKQAAAGNYAPKDVLVEEDRAYNNSIESAYMARMSTDVETTIAQLVRDHPIDQPIESLKANIDAAKKTYIKQAPSAYAMQTGETWDRVGGRGVISVADAQKKYTVEKNFADLNTRFEVISNKLSNADDLESGDVKSLMADAEAVAAQMMNPLYGQSAEKIQAKLDQIRDRIIFRGATNQAMNIYDTQGLEASKAYLEDQRKRTDLGLPDSQRDAIFAEAWGEIRFKDAQRKAEIAEARREQRAALTEAKADMRLRMQGSMLAAARGEPLSDDAPRPEEVRRLFGDDIADSYETAIGASPIIGELKTATNAELVSAINAPQPKMTNAETYKAELKRWEDTRKYAAKVYNDRRTDPMKAHIETGLVPQGDFAKALGSPQALSAFARQRASYASGLSKDFGTRATPFMNQEAQAIGKMLDDPQMPAGARERYLSALNDALKGIPGAYRTLAMQIKPASVKFTAGALLMSVPESRNVGKYSARLASQIVLRGSELLEQTKDDKSSEGKNRNGMPEGLGKKFDQLAGEIYKGDDKARSAAKDVFYAAYAGLREQTGDGYERVDNKVAEDAFKIASGGTGKWRGQKILMPWGMSQDTFDNSIKAGWPKITEKTKALKGTRPEDWDLRIAPGGSYFLVRGNQIATMDNGQPFKLVVGNQ